MNRLAEAGVLVKRRGVDMFGSPGAVQLLRSRRCQAFVQANAVPQQREAAQVDSILQELVCIAAQEVSR